MKWNLSIYDRFNCTFQVNAYEEALREIGSWLSYYDARTHYELYGFAGVLDGDEEHSAYFSMNQNTKHKLYQAGASSLSGLEVRKQVLKNINFNACNVFPLDTNLKSFKTRGKMAALGNKPNNALR